MCVLSLSFALAACRENGAAAPVDAGASPSDAPGAARPRQASGAPPSPRPPPKACKALGASGRVTIADADAGATPFGARTEAPARTWIDLEAKAKLSTKEPTTGRELSFEGPGRVQPCRAWGGEEAWVLRGVALSRPGSGEAPGQEQWIVTPLAVVRYAAASLKVTTDAAVDVHLSGGTASVWLAEGASAASDGGVDGEGWRRLDSGGALTVTAPKAAPEDDARAAVARCSAAAKDARELARAIAEPEAGALGELGVRHLIARRKARASCAVAGLRTAALATSSTRKADLEARVGAAEETWRTIQPLSSP